MNTETATNGIKSLQTPPPHPPVRRVKSTARIDNMSNQRNQIPRLPIEHTVSNYETLGMSTNANRCLFAGSTVMRMLHLTGKIIRA